MGASVQAWLWNHITEKWEKAPAVVDTLKRTTVGRVKASAGKLYWISCNPSVAASVWELSDDTDGSTASVLEHYHTDRESHNTNLVPPKYFANGIYLKTITNMTSMTFGYI